MRAPRANTDRQIRGVSLGAPSCRDERLSFAAFPLPSCQPHVESWCPLKSSSFVLFRPIADGSRSLPLPHDLLLVGAPFLIPTGEKWATAALLPASWAGLGSKPEEEEDWKTLKPQTGVTLQVPTPFSACCLLCTFSSTVCPELSPVIPAGGPAQARALSLHKKGRQMEREGERGASAKQGGRCAPLGPLWGQTPVAWLPELFACLSCFQLSFIQKISTDQI